MATDAKFRGHDGMVPKVGDEVREKEVQGQYGDKSLSVRGDLGVWASVLSRDKEQHGIIPDGLRVRSGAEAINVEDPTKNTEKWVFFPLLPMVVKRLKEQWSSFPGQELQAPSGPPEEEDVMSASIPIDGAIGGRPPKTEEP